MSAELDPVWLPRARREIGVKEIPGCKHHPRILEYQECTRFIEGADEVPWCSAFACWVFERVGISSPKSAAARSWLTWGRGLAEPQLGCIVVMTRAGGADDDASRAPVPGARDTRKGHVGLFVGRSEDGKILVLGGNQKNRVCIQAYDPVRVLGYRWPDLS